MMLLSNISASNSLLFIQQFLCLEAQLQLPVSGVKVVTSSALSIYAMGLYYCTQPVIIYCRHQQVWIVIFEHLKLDNEHNEHQF